MEWANNKFLVLGLARSGQAAIKALLARKAAVAAYDRRTVEELGDEIQKLMSANVEIYAGIEPEPEKMNLSAVILSPAISMENTLVKRALRAGIPIFSELELAFLLKPAEVDICAITGTNGKTTTTALVEYILKCAGREVAAGGNIGVPLVSLWENLLIGTAVAEVSSFQLETADKFQPKVAVILNLTPDHLDRHHTMENYMACKAKIFQAQTSNDFLVLNYDDILVRDLAVNAVSEVIYFSIKQNLSTGVCVNDGDILINRSGTSVKVLSVQDVLIRGTHNLENALAAVAAAHALGVPVDIIASALTSFAGVRHRIEEVGNVKGVLYVNDSKGTNPVSTINALCAFEEPIILIAGGRDKGSDFSDLAELSKTKVKSLLLLGEARNKIYRVMQDSGFPAERISMVENMTQAVDRAAALADSGDVVLLSPACASWDMYNSYEERGDEFCTLVQNRLLTNTDR